MKYFLLAWAISFSNLLSCQEKIKKSEQYKSVPEILVKPSEGVMRISWDTIELKVSETLPADVVKAEDLFRQYLGFQVTPEGRVFYNGREISMLMIDGDPIAVFDYRVVVKNLNAASIKSIEVIQHYHPNRFSNLTTWSNDIAVNLKMKKEYLHKLKMDPLCGINFQKRWSAKLDLLKFSSRFKSITSVDRSKLNYKEISPDAVSKEDIGNYFVRILTYTLAANALPFKKQYLPENLTKQIHTLHAITINTYHKIHVEANAQRLREYSNSNQTTTYIFNDGLGIKENRYSSIFRALAHQELKLNYIHDHFRNNRGEYKIVLNDGMYHDILKDSITRVYTWMNKAQQRYHPFSFMFTGKESILLKNRYVLEIAAQGGDLIMMRTISGTVLDSLSQKFRQQLRSIDISISGKHKKYISYTGLRALTDIRSNQFISKKSYAFFDLQYRLNKKLWLQHNISLGIGDVRFKTEAITQPIYQIEGNWIYEKALFNQFELAYSLKQQVPLMDVMVGDSFTNISGHR